MKPVRARISVQSALVYIVKPNAVDSAKSAQEHGQLFNLGAVGDLRSPASN